MRIALPSHGRRILVATTALAIGLPLGAGAWVEARTRALAARIGAAGGIPVRLGGVDADLTGALRLVDVAFGDLLAADAIEASVALDSLLAGELRADEIRIAAPRVALRVDADGDSDLGRLARRIARRGNATRRARGGVRRIVVSSGVLTAHVAGLGTVSAERVELIPDAGGVRVVTGPVRVHGRRGPIEVELGFARSAAELALPDLTFRRALAVGGTGRVTSSTRAAELSEVAVGRLAADRWLEVRARVDDGGIGRPLTLELAPDELTVRGDRVPLAALGALAPEGLVLDEAHATGAVHVRAASGRLEIEADGALDGLALAHRTLGPAPIPVSASVRAVVALGPEAITVHRLAVTSRAIGLRASGWLRRGAPLSGQLDVQLEPAPCGDLLASVPAELRGPLDGLVVDGELGASLRLALDLASPPGEGATLTTSLEGGCRALSEPPAADVGALRATFEHQRPDGTRARVGIDQPGWVAYRDIPAHVRGAFVSAEDGRFWDHHGFDLRQIARSLEIDLRERRLARGGSTISQQLIKNAFLTHRRTIDRKLQEAILTWRLEDRLDKKQILARYLNLIELGPRIHGIGAAARFWFDRTPGELSSRQAAFLAALTSEPTSMSRRVRRHAGLDPVSADRVATILRAMRRDGVISAAEHDAASGEPLRFSPAAVRDE